MNPHIVHHSIRRDFIHRVGMAGESGGWKFFDGNRPGDVVRPADSDVFFRSARKLCPCAS